MQAVHLAQKLHLKNKQAAGVLTTIFGTVIFVIAGWISVNTSNNCCYAMFALLWGGGWANWTPRDTPYT